MSDTAAELMVKVGADVDGAVNGLHRVNRGVMGFSTSALAMAGGGAAIAGAFGMAIRSAADFETSLNTFRAVSSATGAQMSEVSAKAKALGNDMSLPGTSAQDAADAMTELAKGGLSVGQSMAAAKGVLQLSAAAQIDNATAATITARALNSFGLAGNQATRVADLLAAGANASTAEVSDLAQGFQMAGSVFKMGRQPIDALTTALGLMSNAGISGSDAGTSLKTMMMRLQAPTTDAAKALKGMGVETRDAHGHMLPMRTLIGEFSRATANMSDAQRDAAFSTIFGTDAIRSANVVLAGGVQAWDKMHSAVTKHGAAADMAKAKMQGFNGAMEAFKSTLQTLAIDFGTLLLPPLTTALTALANGVNVVDGFVSSLSSASSSSSAMGQTMASVGAVVGGAVDYIRANWSSLKPVFETVSAGVAAVVAFVGQTINGVAKGIEAHADEIKATLHALRSAFQAVWPQLATIVKAAWSVIKTEVTAALRVIGDIIRIVMAVIRGDWSTAWRMVVDIAKTLLKAAVTVVLTELRALATAVVPLALKAGLWIVKSIGQGLASLAAMLGRALLAIPKALAEAAAGAAAAAVHIGEQIVHGVLSGVGGLGSSLKNKVEGMLHSALSSLNPFSPVEHGGELYIGRPIAEGAIKGYLLAGADMPAKISEHLKTTLQHARDTIDTQRGLVVDAFDRMAEGAFQAFDARTSTMLAGLKVKVSTAFGSFTYSDGGQTPAEKILARAQAYRDEQQRTLALADAQRQLASSQQALADAQTAYDAAMSQQPDDKHDAASVAQAQADATNKLANAKQQLVDQQKQVDDAQFAITQAALEKQAEVERAAAEKKLKKRQLDLQSQRDLQKQHLQAQMDALKAHLEKEPQEFAATHAKVMKMFAKDFGPDMAAAGNNLGQSFATGLNESMGAVAKAASDLAGTVAKYLKLHSPAKAGPLSSLDSWFDAFAPTLLQGLDGSSVKAALTRATAVTVGGGAGLALAGGGGGGIMVGGSSSRGGATTVVELHGATFVGVPDRKVARELKRLIDSADAAPGVG